MRDRWWGPSGSLGSGGHWARGITGLGGSLGSGGHWARGITGLRGALGSGARSPPRPEYNERPLAPKESQLMLRHLLIAAALLPSNISAQDAVNEGPPNFIVFLTDDQGWGDLGCYGHPFLKTPNIDRLASEGMRFTQCYSACGVCSPSRSAILTGRTPYRNGVWRWIPQGHPVHLRTSEITIAELLKDKGYATCHVGKWHLNGHFNSPKQPQPDAHGFDYWFATQNNAAPSHKNPKNFVRNGEPVGQLEGYSAPLVVAEAITWLKEHRDKEKPFYLQVWTHEPHLPIETDPQFQKPYEKNFDEGARQHHGNITQIDHAFGRLMEALDALELSKNTVVIYTADNGPEGNGTPGSTGKRRTRGSTGGLRGRKRADYEGGIRVPGIVRWPGVVPPGSVSDEPVVGSDIFATICDVVKIPLPTDRTIDGASILPAFSSRPIVRKKPLYWRTHIAPPSCRVALRIGDWKIVADEKLTRFELYNLRDDWKELNDLSKSRPEKFEEMKAAIVRMDAEVLAEGPKWPPEPERRRNRRNRPEAKTK